MRVCVAGPRDLWNYDAVECAIYWSGFEITTLVNGGAAGVDTFAAGWADAHGIPIEDHSITDDEWARLGLRAGPMRNRDMARLSEALIVVRRAAEWTRGTRSMYDEARAQGLPVVIYEVLPRDGTLQHAMIRVAGKRRITTTVVEDA